jgi:alginate biosynthesis protein Alg44
MSSAISSIAPNVVHEAVDERQHVRSKLPAQVTLTGADDSFACELQDISLGGLGLHCPRELQPGTLYDAAIELELNQVALTIDARVRVLAERNGLTGVEFVELEPRKRDILRYLLSAYLSGEIADVNGLFNVMQRENYIKQRKQSQGSARTALERARALLGSAGYLLAGLAVTAVLLHKSYLLFFSVAASQALVSADAHILSMPENGYVRFLLPEGVQRVKAGEPIASVSTQLATSFTTPADLEALARLSQNDLASLLGRSLIETSLASPCDCYVYFPRKPVDGYAYKFDELVHLIPTSDDLYVKASFPFDKLKGLHDISAIDLQVFGDPESHKGKVIRSAVDAETQSLVLSIRPETALPLSAYQKPVTVDLFKGLPLTSSL